MKYGTAYKNLTDALLLVAAFVAIVCIVLAVLAFEGPTTVEDPKTGEKISIESAFEDPTVKVYMLLGAIFFITAMLGFLLRQWFMVPLIASAAAIVVSMKIFMDGTIEQVAYAFVVLGIFGFAGNLIHGVITEQEKKEAEAEQKELKKAELHKKSK